MKNAMKIAGFGLLASVAVSMATTGMAAPNGAKAHQGPSAAMGEQIQMFRMTFADLDMDGNGQITEDDLTALMQARFDEADTDGDGLLSSDELVARATARMEERQAMMPERQAAREEAGHTPRGEGPKAGRQAGPGTRLMERFGSPEDAAEFMAFRMLRNQDANDDGALSPEEVGTNFDAARMIDRFDTDDDNAISEAEYDLAVSEMTPRGPFMGRNGPISNR